MIFAQTLADIRRDEGWSSSVYEDTEGIPTVGYGFRCDVGGGWHMPRAAGELCLKIDIEGKWATLVAELPWLEDQPEEVQRALGNMVYQLGVAGLLKFRMMLAALKRGDRETAALNALDSEWAKQTPARARRVTDLIRGYPPEGDD